MFQFTLIVIVLVAFLLSIYLIFYKYIRKYIFGFFRKYIIRKKVKKIAHDHDYLYISNSRMHVNDKKDSDIDNILVTPNYVYVIKNVYYYGVLMAKEVDEKWILNSGNGRSYISNPLNINYLRIKILANQLNLPIDRFKNVVLYGDSLKIYSLDYNPHRNSVFEFYKNFEKKILELESKSEESFSDKQQEEIIEKIYNMNKQSLSYRKENR